MKKKVITKKSDFIVPKEYAKFLYNIKTDIQQTQLRAAISVAKELTLLYWRIGKELTEKTQLEGWGAKVVENLAKDLSSLFPKLTGFSRPNLYRMMAFYAAYHNCLTAVRQLEELPVFNIPWGHNIAIIQEVKNMKERLWYAQRITESGWSRASLVMWIESDLYSRQGKAITNFKKTLPTLPEYNSDLAEQILKDPYNFDFLTMDERAREREIELGLMAHIQKFLLELGQGFAFIGRQYPIQVSNKDFFIDMLFYHLDLRCFIVIELKAEEFAIPNVSQINFYLNAIDDLLKRPGDNPTIGLLLCKTKDNFIAEYALRGINKPIGISSYKTKLIESLPKEFEGKLPTIAEIEAELEKTEIKLEIEEKKVKPIKVAKNTVKHKKSKAVKKTTKAKPVKSLQIKKSRKISQNNTKDNILNKIKKLIKDSPATKKQKKYTKN